MTVEAEESTNFTALDALLAVLGSEFPSLVRNFRTVANESLARLVAACACEDRVAIKAAAHSLKGAALNLYATPLANHCAYLESIATTLDFTTINEAIDKAHTEVEAAVDSIDTWYRQSRLEA